MTEFDDEIEAGMLEIQAELGFPVTVTTYSGPTFEEGDGSGSPGTPSSPTAATMLPPGPVERRYLPENLMRNIEAVGMFVASGLPFTPAKGMLVQWGGNTLRAEWIRNIESGEKTALFMVGLKRA